MAGLSILMTSASKAEFQLYHFKHPGKGARSQALPEHLRAARGRIEPEVISSTRNVSPEPSLCFLERLSEFFAVQSRASCRNDMRLPLEKRVRRFTPVHHFICLGTQL